MAEFTVTTLSDAGADGLVTGTLADEIADGDGLSLREALAFADIDGFDSISFEDSLSGTLRLIQGELQIEPGFTTIVGNGNIVISGDANNDDLTEAGTDITDVSASRANGLLSDNSRIFFAPASLVVLENITLTGGYASVDGDVLSGGAIGGSSSLVLNGVTVVGNSAAGSGGGISALEFSATDVTIRDNEALSGYGGGVFAKNFAEFEDSLIANNTIRGDGNGAGLHSGFSTEVTSSTIHGNAILGSGDGGGIKASGTLILRNSTVAENRIEGDRGQGAGISGDAGFQIINSTITGNEASGSNALAGGVYSVGLGYNSPADASDGSFSITNSIVSGNHATTGTVAEQQITISDRFGAVLTTEGGNIIGETVVSGSTEIGLTTPDQIFADVQTTGSGISGVLGDNGGSVPTVALNPSGVAVDGGELALLPASLNFDVRGEDRVSGVSVDLGAFEFQHAQGTDGPDTLNGTAGANEIDAGPGDDRVFGDGGPDLILAGPGRDQVQGGEGDDTIRGQSGDDFLDGGSGDDTMEGGLGDDRLIVSDAGDLVIELQGEGYDRVMASISFELSDHIEAGNLVGGDDLSMTAASTGSWLFANSGNNTLTGRDGNDRLDGNEGNDAITGAGGNDVLEGGIGRDAFVFAADHGIDLILDFEVGVDLIDYSATGLAFEDLRIVDVAAGGLVISDAGLIALSGVDAELLDPDQFDFSG